MEPAHWIPAGTANLLDVGCNTGDLLFDLQAAFPAIRLSGIDINQQAVAKAKKKLPDADIRQGFGFELPFADNQFQCATCIEVIEHVPGQYRELLLSEIHRVLRPGGLFILRCPHAGIFSWLDAQNFRFRFPRLYRTLVGRGGRDATYEEVKEELVWHHHFTREELLGLAGNNWRVEACQFGGLILFPISDILRWPFYHSHRADNWIVRTLGSIASLELKYSFGRSSYGILLALRKADSNGTRQ